MKPSWMTEAEWAAELLGIIVWGTSRACARYYGENWWKMPLADRNLVVKYRVARE